MDTPSLPILYAFRRCPYVIRTKMVLALCKISYELREISLKNKPDDFLACSPKGTVPVLILPNDQVIDESLDIIHWALSQHYPSHWIPQKQYENINTQPLLTLLHDKLIPCLNDLRYCAPDDQATRQTYQQLLYDLLNHIESELTHHPYICGNKPCLVDILFLPSIRQCHLSNRHWFASLPLTRLHKWLEPWLTSPILTQIMHKHPAWQTTRHPIIINNS